MALTMASHVLNLLSGRCINVYVCVYIYMCVCIYMYIYILCVYIYIYLFIYSFNYLFIYLSIYLYIYIVIISVREKIVWYIDTFEKSAVVANIVIRVHMYMHVYWMAYLVCNIWMI